MTTRIHITSGESPRASVSIPVQTHKGVASAEDTRDLTKLKHFLFRHLAQHATPDDYELTVDGDMIKAPCLMIDPNDVIITKFLRENSFTKTDVSKAMVGIARIMGVSLYNEKALGEVAVDFQACGRLSKNGEIGIVFPRALSSAEKIQECLALPKAVSKMTEDINQHADLIYSELISGRAHGCA
jgi:hypothetical protein